MSNGNTNGVNPRPLDPDYYPMTPVPGFEIVDGGLVASKEFDGDYDELFKMYIDPAGGQSTALPVFQLPSPGSSNGDQVTLETENNKQRLLAGTDQGQTTMGIYSSDINLGDNQDEMNRLAASLEPVREWNEQTQVPNTVATLNQAQSQLVGLIDDNGLLRDPGSSLEHQFPLLNEHAAPPNNLANYNDLPNDQVDDIDWDALIQSIPVDPNFANPDPPHASYLDPRVLDDQVAAPAAELDVKQTAKHIGVTYSPESFETLQKQAERAVQEQRIKGEYIPYQNPIQLLQAEHAGLEAIAHFTDNTSTMSEAPLPHVGAAMTSLTDSIPQTNGGSAQKTPERWVGEHAGSLSAQVYRRQEQWVGEHSQGLSSQVHRRPEQYREAQEFKAQSLSALGTVGAKRKFDKIQQLDEDNEWW